jgi:hypothetical protein
VVVVVVVACPIWWWQPCCVRLARVARLAQLCRFPGVVPVTEVPALALVLGLVALVVAGNLLASVPAAMAARTRPGAWLRAQ